MDVSSRVLYLFFEFSLPCRLYLRTFKESRTRARFANILINTIKSKSPGAPIFTAIIKTSQLFFGGTEFHSLFCRNKQEELGFVEKIQFLGNSFHK